MTNILEPRTEQTMNRATRRKLARAQKSSRYAGTREDDGEPQ
jgi:hypothetical protein